MPSGRSRARSRRPRVYDPEQTRRALLDASIGLFGSQGFHSTSVREIVDVAGVTKGAFYHHFESKEDVLHMIHDEFVDFQIDAQQRILERFDSPQERLLHLIRLLVFVIAAYHPNVTVFLNTHKALRRTEFTELFEKRRSVRETYTAVISDGIENGEFRADLDPRLGALGVLGMCNWMYQWYNPAGDLPPEDIAAELVGLGLHSVCADPVAVAELVARPIPDPDPVRDFLPHSISARPPGPA